MAIFGRSKKSKTKSLEQQSSGNFYQQPYQTQYATESLPSWTYVEQRPSDPYIFNQPQTHGWLIAPIPPQYQPVLVPQNYITPPQLPQRPGNNVGNISTLKLCSTSNLLFNHPYNSEARLVHDEATPFYLQNTEYLTQGAALCDLISSKFNAVITLIDGERFSGDERELRVLAPPQPLLRQQQETGITERSLGNGKSKGMVNNSVSSALSSTNYFAKVHLYANSRLPPNFPPMKL
jgi:hypothetical protein